MSVIIPCFNHAEFVEMAVASILKQTHHELEVIVVDDKSADKSVEAIKRVAATDPRIQVILHTINKGASNSRNDGIEAARGKLIAFCDADDVWLPDKLAAQVKLIQSSPECVLVYCDSEVVNESGESCNSRFSDLFWLPNPASGRLFEALCLRNFLNTQTVLLRKSCLPAARPFDERIQWVEDWWLWLQLSRRGSFLYDKTVLAKYRVHSRSTSTAQRPGIVRNRFKVLNRNVRHHRDMPAHLLVETWYGMGRTLQRMGKPRFAAQFMLQALAVSIRRRSLLGRSHRTLGRLLQAQGEVILQSVLRRKRLRAES